MEICIDFQKVFDTVDHNIIIQKLNYYGLRVTTNTSLSSHLEDRTQFVNINGYPSDLHFIGCGKSQGSILGPFLFVIYIKDQHHTIKKVIQEVHYFADKTNIPNFSNSMKKMNKKINYNLNILNN